MHRVDCYTVSQSASAGDGDTFFLAVLGNPFGLESGRWDRLPEFSS